MRQTNKFFAGEDLGEGRVSERDRSGRRVKRTYIDGDEVDLGVTVLARLGGGHVNDLAGTTWAGGRRQLAD